MSQPVPNQPLSIIVPVFNEAENFPRVIAEIERYIPPPYTVLMVYDFDADSTVPVARQLAETRPWLRLLKNTLGRGVVFALRAGFAAVPSGPALVVMGDLSDDLSIVPRLLELYGAGFSIVCPSRYMPGGKQIGGPWLKGFLSWLAGKTLYYVGRFPTQDATNNFRLYDANLVRQLGIESVGGFELALELTAKAFRRQARITEVPSVWRDRTAGESRFRLLHWLPLYLYWYLYAFCLLPRRPLVTILPPDASAPAPLSTESR